ncbi:hypothetical protein COI_1599 [Mannheimia haemolytica serotype A2 str. OVINE]|nr:hypothetical protein COI_1599 [Mannheimia haemolytica serotype A2 str. OVINE]
MGHFLHGRYLPLYVPAEEGKQLMGEIQGIELNISSGISW